MPELDKKAHYGRYQDGEDRRAKLAYRMASKALDIPDDEMQIDASRKGLSGLAAVGVALAAAAVPTALAGYLALRPGNTSPAPAPPVPVVAPAVPPPAPPQAVEWELEIGVKDGKGFITDPKQVK